MACSYRLNAQIQTSMGDFNLDGEAHAKVARHLGVEEAPREQLVGAPI